MELFEKSFYELSLDELFEIYQLRSAVFVVEQECVYQDVDEHDKKSMHVFLKDGGKIAAYLRVLPAGATFDDVSIGRVISVNRRCGMGTRIVREGIRVAKERFNADVITIEAQTYARKLYENLGFVQQSEEFLEDGIPHILMKLFCK